MNFRFICFKIRNEKNETDSIAKILWHEWFSTSAASMALDEWETVCVLWFLSFLDSDFGRKDHENRQTLLSSWL